MNVCSDTVHSTELGKAHTFH